MSLWFLCLFIFMMFPFWHFIEEVYRRHCCCINKRGKGAKALASTPPAPLQFIKNQYLLQQLVHGETSLWSQLVIGHLISWFLIQVEVSSQFELGKCNLLRFFRVCGAYSCGIKDTRVPVVIYDIYQKIEFEKKTNVFEYKHMGILEKYVFLWVIKMFRYFLNALKLNHHKEFNTKNLNFLTRCIWVLTHVMQVIKKWWSSIFMNST